jgi:hypothetical protein
VSPTSSTEAMPTSQAAPNRSGALATPYTGALSLNQPSEIQEYTIHLEDEVREDSGGESPYSSPKCGSPMVGSPNTTHLAWGGGEEVESGTSPVGKRTKEHKNKRNKTEKEGDGGRGAVVDSVIVENSGDRERRGKDKSGKKEKKTKRKSSDEEGDVEDTRGGDDRGKRGEGAREEKGRDGDDVWVGILLPKKSRKEKKEKKEKKGKASQNEGSDDGGDDDVVAKSSSRGKKSKSSKEKKSKSKHMDE